MCSKTGNIKKEVVGLREVMTNPHTGWWTKRCKMTAFPELTGSYFSTVDLTDMLNSDATKRLLSSHCLPGAVPGALGLQRWIKHPPYPWELTLKDRGPSPCPSAVEPQVMLAWQLCSLCPLHLHSGSPPVNVTPIFHDHMVEDMYHSLAVEKTLSRLIQTFLFFSLTVQMFYCF